MNVQVGNKVQFRNMSKQLVTGTVYQVNGALVYIKCDNGIKEAAFISDREFHVINAATGQHSQTTAYYQQEANDVSGAGCTMVFIILLAVAMFVYIGVTGTSPTDLLQ